MIALLMQPGSARFGAPRPEGRGPRVSAVASAISVLMVSLLLSACNGASSDASLQAAKAHLAKHDGKAAIIEVKNVLQSNPSSAEARYLLGAALLETGSAASAEAQLRKALELGYSRDLVVPKLASALFAQGESKKLVDEFGAVALDSPSGTADLHTALGNAYALMGDAVRANKAFETALGAVPNHTAARIARARQTATEGRADESLATLDAILSATPDESAGWKLRGDIYMYYKNDLAKAVENYRRAIAVRGDALPAHLSMLTVLVQQGNLVEAQKELAVAKQLAPGNLQVRYIEALVAYNKNDLKQARSLAQQLLKVLPDSPAILLLAGSVELRNDSVLQAERYLSQAVQSAPQIALARRMLVMTYLRSAQPDRALSVLLAGRAKEDIPAELFSIAGETFLQNGDVRAAEEFYAKAAKQDPTDAKKRTSLALSHYVGGQTDLAVQELYRISASDTGTSADMALISAHWKLKEYDKALSVIDGLERKQPDKPLAANFRGRTKLALNDTAGARASFERALSISPTYFPAAASLAAMDVADKKPADARQRIERFLIKDPKNVQALITVAELAAMTGAGKDEVAALLATAVAADTADPTPRVLLIDLYLRHKDLKQALLTAQNAVAALPNRLEALEALGRVQQATGEYNQAIATFTKWAELRPNSPQPHMRLADVHLAAKNRQAAERSLRRSLEIRPDTLEAQRRLASLDFAADRFQDALEIARTVQRQRPQESTGYAMEGDISAARKKWSDAESAYRSGLKQSASSELAIKLHSVLTAASKQVEADKLLTNWLAEHPQDAVFRFYLGDTALVRKDFAAAEKQYESVVKLQPDNAAALNNLAWVSSQLNRQGAIGYAQRAVELAPEQPAFMDTLATILADAGQLDRAVAMQVKAVALQPKVRSYRLNMARIYLKAGNKQEAKRQLDEVVAGDDKSVQAEVAALRKSF